MLPAEMDRLIGISIVYSMKNTYDEKSCSFN